MQMNPIATSKFKHSPCKLANKRKNSKKTAG